MHRLGIVLLEFNFRLPSVHIYRAVGADFDLVER